MTEHIPIICLVAGLAVGIGEKTNALALYKQGLSSYAIERLLGVPTYRTVHQWTQEAGITRKKVKISAVTKRMVVILYNSGMDWRDIKKELNLTVTRSAIGSWVRKGGATRKAYQSGEKAHNWQGGVNTVADSIRNSQEYIAWRTSVYERDNFACLCCGKVGGRLHAHHILAFSKYPALRFDINNGSTLCKKCHIQLHKKKKKARAA